MNPGSVPQARQAVKGAMVLAHHAPEDHDRCFRLPLPGGRVLPVCARCLGLYPIAFATLGLALFAGLSADWMDPWGVWVLPLPTLVDALTDWLGLRTSSNSVRFLTALPAGLALGRLFERYLADPLDPLFWGVVALYGGIGGIGALVGLFRRARDRGPV